MFVKMPAATHQSRVYLGTDGVNSLRCFGVLLKA